MKLYDLELSGNCYKIRLFCALNNIDLDIIAVDYLAGEHKQAKFLALNPLGQIPVLADNQLILRDSQAILVYLAANNKLRQWWPSCPVAQGTIMQWLSFSANEIARGPGDARLHDLFSVPLNINVAREQAHAGLTIIEAQLKQSPWLVDNQPTLADIACFPYIALSHQGGVSLNNYPNILSWINRIKALDGYLSMPGID